MKAIVTNGSDVTDANADLTTQANANIINASGIGLLFQNSFYDANNRTLISGAANDPDNVYAVYNTGLSSPPAAGDFPNVNSYALVANVLSADQILLGESFFANGQATGGNVLFNVTSALNGTGIGAGGNAFAVVNLTDYADDTVDTFAGGSNFITQEIQLRTSSEDNVWLQSTPVSNGNVNTVQFSSSAINDGFQLFNSGARNFRFMQMKFVITNSNPDQVDFTLDKFNYTINKKTETFTTTQVYDSTTTAIDISGANFLDTPAVSLTPLENSPSTNVITLIATAISKTSVSVKAFNTSDGSAAPTGGQTTINLTATGA